jgi:hypothetical protein
MATAPQARMRDNRLGRAVDEVDCEIAEDDVGLLVPRPVGLLVGLSAGTHVPFVGNNSILSQPDQLAQFTA